MGQQKTILEIKQRKGHSTASGDKEAVKKFID